MLRHDLTANSAGIARILISIYSYSGKLTLSVGYSAKESSSFRATGSAVGFILNVSAAIYLSVGA
jgi:hypothetical protein